MAARQDDKGIKGFLIWDCGLRGGIEKYSGQLAASRGKEKEEEERDFPVGAAFSRDLVL